MSSNFSNCMKICQHQDSNAEPFAAIANALPIEQSERHPNEQVSLGQLLGNDTLFII